MGRERGFTLIELMVVVAIIGLLTATAYPNYAKFQARARQAEVKANLKSYFTAVKGQFAETNRWTCGACGWALDPGSYGYNYFLSGSVWLTAGSYGCDASSILAAEQSDPDFNGGTLGGFTAGATANIDADMTCDGWNINDDSALVNTLSDLTY